ncbi:hypothetical protein PLESTB_001713500 [Pleodorina starrii]|uniref:Uncharacterized protein n=1 Tax=Pleodorina starrii TaxID=330485 RepID=A0A9W6BZC4_9CHLO|nr:hypothetical protein PLESTB_001713500 [Pleodorina starrii]GLC75873.1 hypothetical protein PLESTF_001699000 [Pleodorina starrii]
MRYDVEPRPADVVPGTGMGISPPTGSDRAPAASMRPTGAGAGAGGAASSLGSRQQQETQLKERAGWHAWMLFFGPDSAAAAAAGTGAAAAEPPVTAAVAAAAVAVGSVGSRWCPVGRRAAVRLAVRGAMVLLLAAVVSQAYDISKLEFSSSYYSSVPVLVLGSDKSLPNEPKAAAGLLVSGCSGDGGGNGTHGGAQGGRWGHCCIGCDKSPQLRLRVGAELRGRSSQAAAKKSYSIELRSSDGSEAPTPLLGLPAAADWVLYGPSLDRSLIRDALSYELARAQGRWASRSVFVELFVIDDGSQQLDQEKHYKGLYALTEPIQRGRNRLNIQKLESDKDISGGYILELSNAAATEWWAANLGEELPASVSKMGPTRVEFKYPSPSRAPSPSWYFVSSLMSNLSSALQSAQSYGSAEDLSYLIDVPSLADFMLHTELSCDYDGFVSSVFLHKDRGGPLVAGPVWDKNLAYGNEVEVTSPSGCGWRYAAAAVQNSGQVAVWMASLARAGWWRAAVADRWRQLRGSDGDGPWSDSSLEGLVRRLAAHIPPDVAARNFERWPLQSTHSNQRFVTLPPAKGSWEAEVEALRGWLLDRAHWLDGKLLRESGGPDLAAPSPPTLLTGVLGAVLGGRTVARAFQENLGVGGRRLQGGTALVQDTELA